MFDLSLAISHHLLIFALFGILAAELVLVRSNLDRAAVSRVGTIDLWYGVVAGAILIVGFTRAIFAAKGWAYYEHNAFFWAKMAAFVCVALLSVPPTIKYIRWQRASALPNATEIAVVRRFLWAEVALFALLPAFAAAMARGFGEAGY
jgi:putative membrane protein